MTKASPLLIPGPQPINASTTRTIRMGKWVFTPTGGHPIWGTHATLHDKDQCIALQHSSCLLENLLAQLGNVEDHFTNAFSTPGTGEEHTRQPNSNTVRE